MGTHANIIIKFKNKKIKLYNHFDSYFSHLGIKIIRDIIKLLSENSIDEIIEKFDSHIIINEDEIIEDYEKSLFKYININTFKYIEDDVIEIYKKYKGIIEDNFTFDNRHVKEKYLNEIKVFLDDKDCYFHKYLVKELFKYCNQFKEEPLKYLIKFTCHDKYVYSIYKVFKHEYLYVEYCDDVDWEYIIDFNEKKFISKNYYDIDSMIPLKFDDLEDLLKNYENDKNLEKIDNLHLFVMKNYWP